MRGQMSLFLKGMAMGIAEIIPGVSGGTIAFITGIYEELINTIKGVNLDLLGSFRKDGLPGFWKALNGKFIATLGVGMLFGVLVGLFGVTYLLEHYPEPLWGFFFGLIAASAVYLGGQIENWNSKTLASFAIGAIVAFGITLLSPADGTTNLWYVFISGCIAICALMLPGISGSFILLLMGMYTIIIPTIKNMISTFDFSEIWVVIVFILGCLTGLLGFSRVLSLLLEKYKEVTFALLTGFLVGALNKVWPWRNITSIMEKESGEIHSINVEHPVSLFEGLEFKILQEVNVLPATYTDGSPRVFLTISFFFIGIALVYLLSKYEEK